MPALTFTDEEIKNLIALVNRVQITGAEALPVALLMQKLTAAMQVAQPNGVAKVSAAKRPASE